jgi:hypothetical protein
VSTEKENFTTGETLTLASQRAPVQGFRRGMESRVRPPEGPRARLDRSEEFPEILGFVHTCIPAYLHTYTDPLKNYDQRQGGTLQRRGTIAARMTCHGSPFLPLVKKHASKLYTPIGISGIFRRGKK